MTFSVSNASPEIVEKLATSPLENALSQLPDVKEIKSNSSYNRGNITLNFDKKVDMEIKKFEVAALIRQIYPKLDQQVGYPSMTFSSDPNLNRSPILIYSINAPFAAFEIKKVSEDIIKQGLTRLQEIEEINVYGAEELQITINYDIQRLYAYGINRNDIVSQINESFGLSYPGTVSNSSGQTLFLRYDRQLNDISQLEDLIIARKNNKDIRLREIATVAVEEAEARSYYRINGKNSVTLSVMAREGVNKAVLGTQIKNMVEDLGKIMPPGYDIRLEQDNTEYLAKELDKIYKRSGLSILILIFFIFLMNRNWRYLLTLFSGIVVNLAITSIFVYILGIDIHLYSLAGLTISFGLIVDNAIIMIDHLHKYKNRKVFVALLAASLTTVAALLMVFFLPEKDQQNLLDFSKVVAITLSVSLLVALLFTPAMYSLLFGDRVKAKRQLSFKNLRLRAKGFRAYERSLSFIGRKRGWLVVLMIFGFGIPVFMLPAKWEGQEWYNKTIGSTVYQETIRPISDKVLGGSLRMFVRGVYEKYGYREPEKTQLFVTARLPYGNTLEQMNIIMKEFEDYLSTIDGIDKYVTRVSSGQSAQITITFDEENEKGALPYQLKARLQNKSVDWSGVRWGIYGVGQGFSIGGSNESIPSYRVTMMGYNFDELERQAEVMAEKLLAHKRIQEVNTNEFMYGSSSKTEEFVLSLDPTNIVMNNTSRGEIVNTLLDLSKPSGPSTYLALGDKVFPVVIKEDESDSFSNYQLMEESLTAETGRIFKIKNIGELKFQTTVNTISKENRQYIRIVSFEYYGSNKFGQEYLDEVIEEMENQMPVGYTIEKSRYPGFGQGAKRQYSLLVLLIIVIFFLCGILFENLKQPFYIILIIPISFIGLFLIFSVFDFAFDQGGYAAFVMLGGLAVNAAIFVVNDLNNRSEGVYNRRIIKAIAGKAQPIMLTILSTCFGLIPFIMQGQNEVFWFSLAIGTIGGLIFSLVGIFICLPAFLWQKVKR